MAADYSFQGSYQCGESNIYLYSIILPSALFTAAVFDIPEWAQQTVQNNVQTILWASATSTEANRHKINPGLIFTPKRSGGVELASFEVAIKTQCTKHALQWITQAHDNIFASWYYWAYQSRPTRSALDLYGRSMLETASSRSTKTSKAA